jgi:hypothetical protein
MAGDYMEGQFILRVKGAVAVRTLSVFFCWRVATTMLRASLFHAAFTVKVNHTSKPIIAQNAGQRR